MDMGNSSAEYAAVFQQAAARWESIIIADLTDFSAQDAPSDGLGWYDDIALLFYAVLSARTLHRFVSSAACI
jgi:hypothetical protein